ncbi:hypothetical protein ACFT5B_08815 [Luteimicrobium sp. NPDC057192]
MVTYRKDGRLGRLVLRGELDVCASSPPVADCPLQEVDLQQ